jgi:hypothetical protein
VTSRRTGRRKDCTVTDAKARLDDAEAFLDAAEISENVDVIATNAIHAAIAASDAICCVALRQRSADGDHNAAVWLLGQVDKKLAHALSRSLNNKTQASYESRSVSATDAAACVRQATALVDAARDRLLTT